MILDKYHS